MISKQFITAGKATFTVQSVSGDYYTFRVNRKEASGNYKEAYFANVLTGPDNTTDYTYIGMVDPQTGRVALTKSSKYNADSTIYRVLGWALHHIWNQKEIPAGYQIRHEGHCARCGRALTTPTSLDTGIGPECAKKVG